MTFRRSGQVDHGERLRFVTVKAEIASCAVVSAATCGRRDAGWRHQAVAGSPPRALSATITDAGVTAVLVHRDRLIGRA